MPRFLAPLIAALGLSAVLAPSAHAIVNGEPVPAGQRGYVAFVSLANPPGSPFGGTFQCTGTLVAPTLVATAAHCSSATGAAAGSPIGMPGQTIEVTLGSVKPDDPQGEKFRPSEVIVPPDYNASNGLLVADERSTGDSNDFSLLRLPSRSKQTPVPIAAKGEREIWNAGKLAQIAGFGVTEEDGETPDVMQQAVVPIVDDQVAKTAYPGSFENATQLGAGYPQGGTDTCQGDSGGPLLVPAADGSLRLVGDTSYGDGCARPNKPGIYGRLADEKIREFIRVREPAAIAPEPTGTSPGSSQPPPTSSGADAAPTPSATPSAAAASTPRSPLVLTAALDLRRLRFALTRGVRLRVRTSAASDVSGTLKLGKRVVATGRLKGVTGRKTFSLRFSKAGRKALKGRRTAGLTLTVVATGADGQKRSSLKRVTLRR